VHTFKSLTISDSEFLKGQASNQEVLLSGILRLPLNAEGTKLPTIILVHGSAGVGPSTEDWQYFFNDLGYATFVMDSFTGRGLKVVSNDQGKLGRFNMTLDTFKAWEMLSKDARLDSSKMAVLGQSRGGTAVIYSAMQRFQKLWSPQFRVKVTIAMYPSCFDHIDEDERVESTLREYHGDLDDYASTQQCSNWIQRLEQLNIDAHSTVFSGVAHSFDSPLGVLAPKTSVNIGSQSQTQCKVVEKNGVLFNVNEGHEFSYKDACVTLDPHSNSAPKETAQVREEVRKLLKEKFE
jgi:dienelactone hydrolase